MGPCQSVNKDLNIHTTKQNNQMDFLNKNRQPSKYISNKFISNHIKRKNNEDMTRENNCSHESCSSSNSLLNSTVTLTLETTIQAIDSLFFTKKGDAFLFTDIKGQWSIMPEYGMTSYEGYKIIQSSQHNLGCLLFRILGGKTLKAEVNKQYIADSTGQIQFFPNIDENDISFYQPKGYLEITAKGILQLSQSTIDSACGWVNLPSSICPLLSQSENMIVNYINKIRSSPKLFSNLYLNSSPAYKEISGLLFEYTPIPHLVINESLIKTAQAHSKDIGESGITGHIGTDNSTLKERITKYSRDKSIIYFGENCYYGINNPLALVIEMIFDNKSINKSNRMNILNPLFNSIGVSIYKHHAFKWCCIIAFGEII